MNQELKAILSTLEKYTAGKTSTEIATVMLEINKVLTLNAEFADIKAREKGW